jgi:peptidoglycan/xylan/chitin deacetylase (PgdA/CDA1 family)
MHSSWFRKPIYKRLNLLSFLIVVISIGTIPFAQFGWIILISVLVFWTVFSAISSYYIFSGVYVSAICSFPVKEKVVCLTFDDGPCENTDLVLQLLENHNAKATFFITGNKVTGMENTLGKISRKGHEMGNHSYTHKHWFPLMRVKKIKAEIEDTQKIIRKITGREPVYFRPPFGVTNPLIAKALKSFQLITIGWSIRSMDTTNRPSSKIVSKIIRQIKPGSIILLHDTSGNIHSILKEVLVYCRQENYKLVTISELLKLGNE